MTKNKINGFSIHDNNQTKKHISDIQYQVKENNEDIKKAIKQNRENISKKYLGVFEIENRKDSRQLGFGIVDNSDVTIEYNNNRINKQEQEGRKEQKRLLQQGIEILKGSGFHVKNKKGRAMSF